jgi:cyclic dehypoxanthinyl futalosine synthase
MGQVALQFGANDFGSLMMEENVVSSAGTSFRLSLEEMRRLIVQAGYEPRQRNNAYELVDADIEKAALTA